MEIRNLRIERNRKHGEEFPSDTKTSQVFFRYMTLASFPFAQLLAFYRKTFRILPLTYCLPPLTFLFCIDHEPLAHPFYLFQGMKWIVFLKCIFMFFPL